MLEFYFLEDQFLIRFTKTSKASYTHLIKVEEKSRKTQPTTRKENTERKRKKIWPALENLKYKCWINGYINIYTQFIQKTKTKKKQIIKFKWKQNNKYIHNKYLIGHANEYTMKQKGINDANENEMKNACSTKLLEINKLQIQNKSKIHIQMPKIPKKKQKNNGKFQFKMLVGK